MSTKEGLPEDRLAEEARLLSAAVVRLRYARDAAGALAHLDRYRGRFPRGTLATEANTLRISALLLLQRDSEALAELDGMALGDATSHERELRAIRGELRGRITPGVGTPSTTSTHRKR